MTGVVPPFYFSSKSKQRPGHFQQYGYQQGIEVEEAEEKEFKGRAQPTLFIYIFHGYKSIKRNKPEGDPEEVRSCGPANQQEERKQQEGQ